MAGLYLHIPFCKQACHYCDFHFSTSLKLKDPLLLALQKEIESRKNELDGEEIQSIYFGGGTPSILKTDELKKIFEVLFNNYRIANNAEITFEANPDDLNQTKIKELRDTPINRFSIGVQSFHNDDLLYMNRVHNASEAEASIKASQDAGFENLTIDLIYGMPTLTDAGLQENLRKSVSLEVPHLSCYALTVEDRTALSALIKKNKVAAVEDEKVSRHFIMMAEGLVKEGFVHYEISNFARKGSQSKHNSSYWHGISYLGFGPGAHSFNGINKRRWNISNNAKYINLVNNDENFFEVEYLGVNDRYNEYVLTRLRLEEGIGLQELEIKFGSEYLTHLLAITDKWDKKWYAWSGKFLTLTNTGKLISDRLAADLFKLD